MRRAAWFVPLLGTVASLGVAGPAALPDLEVPRSELRRTPAGLEVKVGNRGTAAAPRAVVRVQDAPPLLARGAAHEILAGERAAVFHAERDTAGRLWLVMAWSAPRPGDHVHGRLALIGGRFAAPPPAPSIEARVESPERLSLETGPVPEGVARFEVEPTEADRPVVLDLSGIAISGRGRPRETWFGHRWIAASSGDDDDGGAASEDEAPGRFELAPGPRPEPAWTAATALPPLAPGDAAVVRFDAAPAGRPLYVTVDPGDEVEEEREGNNAAVFEPPGRGSLAALHVHTSFSEGRASFDLQCRALGESGYGLAWITDHDWRLRLLGFAAASPGGGGWPGRGRLEVGEWDLEAATTRPPLTGGPEDRAAEAGVVLDMPAGGAGAGRPGPREQTVTVREPRNTHLLPLAADVRLRLRLDDPALPGGTAVLVRLTLSDHPGERRRLSYLISPAGSGARDLALPGERTRFLALPAGRPATLDIDVSGDARASWPGPLDDHLHQIEVGLRRTDRQAASIRLLEIRTRAGEGGATLFAAARGLAASYSNIALAIGAEISHPYPHFNSFAPELPLLDYDSLHERDAYAVEAVRRTRALGGLVSFNHPFGALLRYEPEFLEHVLARRFYDADLLEVGYRRRGGRTLEDHLALWDRAGASGVVLTGVGVTDSHGEGPGIGWHPDESNLATRICSTDAAAALRDLATGCAAIEDPLVFSGTLELGLAGRVRQGAVVVVDPERDRPPVLTVTGSALPSGSEVVILAGGDRVESLRVSSPDLLHEFQVQGAPGPVRVELRDAAGAPLILGNPVTVLAPEALPDGGVDAGRAALVTDDFSMVGGRGFRLRSVVRRRGVPGFGRGALEMHVEAEAGGELSVHWASKEAMGRITATGPGEKPIPVQAPSPSGEAVAGPFPVPGMVRILVRPATGARRWVLGAGLTGAALLMGLALMGVRRFRAGRGPAA